MIWHTPSQAAERVGVQTRTIRAWIKAGELSTIRHDLAPGALFIPEEELLATFRAKRARGGYVGRVA